MMIGQTVHLYDRKSGKRQKALVIAIVGVGKSNCKHLKLEVGKETFNKVIHWFDARRCSSCNTFWSRPEDESPKNWKKSTKPVKKTTEPAEKPTETKTE